MTIEQLNNLEMSTVVAYIVGMTLPLYKEKELNGTCYIVGAVNHNPRPQGIAEDNLRYVSEVDLLEHFSIVNTFVNGTTPQDSQNFLLLANRNEYGSISSKKGFSILIEKGNKSTEECKNILLSKLESISNNSTDIKCSFIKGCFDGRSSIDWGNENDEGFRAVRYISVDVDRNYNLQTMIKSIAASINIELNLNQRNNGHSRNDQIRITPNSFESFFSQCAFFSPFRNRQIKNVLGYAN